MERIQKILTNIANEELLFPIDFSLSVHNAIIGMFSIITKNTQMNTALSGGNSGFAAGFLEAYALQKATGKSVGYLYCDNNLSAKYKDFIKEKPKEIYVAVIIGEDDEQKCL